MALSNTLDQINVRENFQTFHLITTEYTFSSSAHRTLPKIDHILGHKISIDKFKNVQIISGIFSDHYDMKLEINFWKNTGKNISRDSTTCC